MFRVLYIITFYTKGDDGGIEFGGGSGNFDRRLDDDIFHGSNHPISAKEDFMCSGLKLWALCRFCNKDMKTKNVVSTGD